MKLRYRVDGYLLVVSISIGNSCDVVLEQPFYCRFQWELKDPYFGFRSTWDTEKNKKRWISPALATYCKAPGSYEALNNCAIAHTDRKGLEHVIAKIFQEWKKYHVERKLAETQLQQLKHHTI